MRICYFADGRYIHALRWMKFFAEHGHEMHLISFAPMTAENISRMESIGVKCHGDIRNFHIKRFWKTLVDLKKLRTVLKSEKIDILHCHFLGSNTWYAALSGFHPYIITVMGGDVIGRNWKPDSSWRESILTRLALRKADALTTWSQKLTRSIRPYSSSDTPVEVVHGGIPLERFSPGPKPLFLLKSLNIPDESVIIFSPRLMRPLYNIIEIAEAMGPLVSKMPNIFFVIACPEHIGDTEYLEKLEQTLSENGAFGNSRFVSGISHDEIADYFRLADVTVSIPSTDGTPMTVLESMACGTPTVIGGLHDYDRTYFEHEKTTMMVDVENPASIADAIMRLLNDDQLSAALTHEARRRVVETGGYEFQMGKMEKLYQHVMSLGKRKKKRWGRNLRSSI